jgi:hypothetical protein
MIAAFMPAASSARPSRLDAGGDDASADHLEAGVARGLVDLRGQLLEDRVEARLVKDRGDAPASAVGPNVTSGRKLVGRDRDLLVSQRHRDGAVMRSAAALAAVASSVLTVGSIVVVTRSASTSAGASNEDRAAWPWRSRRPRRRCGPFDR